MANLARQRDPRYLNGHNGTGSTISAGYGVVGSLAAITLPAAITDAGLGVVARDIADGADGDVQYEGVVPAVGGASITAGARVYCATTGKFLTWNPASGVNASVWGIALTDCDGDTKSFELLLGKGGIGQGA